MLDSYDILKIIAINFAVNLIQPVINNFFFNLFKKISSKLVGWLLKRAGRELQIKAQKIKKNATPSEVLQNKSINFVQTNLPVVIEKFQKSGLDGLINMASEKINTFLKPVNNSTTTTTETTTVEDITDEAKELQKYRLEKLEKVATD